MKKYCLLVTEERDICTPKLFCTYDEAYAKMKSLLISNIRGTDHADDYLDEHGELVTLEEPGEFGIGENFMWSNLNEDYALDAKIFVFKDGAFTDDVKK